ncbi:SMI1/KNR4 family protein [Catenulispora rubra]|uniref:SMI1/KNR4 family protein n=1 Tax=Catenulispora rubra TaxID=280293 RepID=UPI001E3AFA07|nr:SMI1/KNR4 family protein [Catenulispora rubra]
MTEPVPGSPAATSADVERAQAEVGRHLPAPLVALWKVTDGLITDAGVTVYSAGCIGERNTTYEVAQYAPGFVLIGDDSGGRGFLLRADDPHSAVFSSDLGDLGPEDFEVESVDFASWIESL